MDITFLELLHQRHQVGAKNTKNRYIMNPFVAFGSPLWTFVV